MVISTALTSGAYYISSSYGSLKILPLQFRELIMPSVWVCNVARAQCIASILHMILCHYLWGGLSDLAEKKHATASGGSVHHGGWPCNHGCKDCCKFTRYRLVNPDLQQLLQICGGTGTRVGTWLPTLGSYISPRRVAPGSTPLLMVQIFVTVSPFPGDNILIPTHI